VPTNPINVAFPSTSCRSDDNIFLKNGNDWSGSSIVLQMAVETMNIASQSATYSFSGFVQPSRPDQNRKPRTQSLTEKLKKTCQFSSRFDL
jgi:hypothetical protein